MQKYITVCEKAAHLAGEVLLQWQGKVKPHEKGPRDLVTEADFAAQRVIRETLLDAFPNHTFLGEEDEPDEGEASQSTAKARLTADEYCWVVDPLDGTTNYVHQLQTFAVSIALVKAGKVVLGVVYDPIAKECYRAAAGEGAFLNNKEIFVSGCERLEEGLIAVSFPANISRGSREVARFEEVLYRSRAVRRLGSAALNLCYLAAGRLDAYWATNTKAWDIAAGVLLVQEAGGVVTADDGGEFDLTKPRFAASSTQALHQQFLEVLDTPAPSGEA